MQISKIGVTVSRRLDTGYGPYMKYLRELGGRAPAFGTRDNSNAEFSVYVGADLEPGDDIDAAITECIALGRAHIRNQVGQLRGTAPAPTDEEALEVDSTTVRFEEAEV